MNPPNEQGGRVGAHGELTRKLRLVARFHRRPTLDVPLTRTFPASIQLLLATPPSENEIREGWNQESEPQIKRIRMTRRHQGL